MKDKDNIDEPNYALMHKVSVQGLSQLYALDFYYYYYYYVPDSYQNISHIFG